MIMLDSYRAIFWCRAITRIVVVLVLAGAFGPFVARGTGIVSAPDEESFDQALAGGGLVTLQFSGTLTLTVEKVISTNTTLDAMGFTNVTLSGDAEVPLFTVNPGVTLTLRNLTLADGRHAGEHGTNGGGGSAAFGGAIYNDAGIVTATACVFSNNVARGGDGGDGVVQLNGRGGNGGNGGSASGGAIYNNSGTLWLTNCTFATNTATGGAGGAGADAVTGSNGDGGDGGQGGVAGGGAIYNAPGGSIVAYDCTFLGNGVRGALGGTNGLGSGGLGFDGSNGSPGPGYSGGIFNNGGTVTVLFSTFNVNTARGADGGIGPNGPLDGDGSGGRSGSSGNGGAIFSSGGVLALTNCTFVANSVTGGNGGKGGDGGTVGFGGDGGNGGNGGAANGGAVYGSDSVTAILVNCTFSQNKATGGTGGTGGAAGSSVTISGRAGADGANFGGGIASGGGALVLKNSILAYSSSGGNGAGTITDGGNNLSSDASPLFTSAASFNSKDPLLATLADNGGLTRTAALSAGSPAIDQGNDAVCLPEDQRHRARSDQCDMGAYEFGGRAPVAELVARRIESQLVLTWPTLVSGYTLQSTPSLAPAAWTEVTNIPAVVSFEYVLTNTIEATDRFYRLIK